jgi:hypothetical protein
VAAACAILAGPLAPAAVVGSPAVGRYDVDPAAGDTGSGSEAQLFRTITQALADVRPGDACRYGRGPSARSPTSWPSPDASCAPPAATCSTSTPTGPGPTSPPPATPDWQHSPLPDHQPRPNQDPEHRPPTAEPGNTTAHPGNNALNPIQELKSRSQYGRYERSRLVSRAGIETVLVSVIPRSGRVSGGAPQDGGRGLGVRQLSP